MHDSIVAAFEQVDIDRNGHIDQSEFAQLATGLGASLSPDEIENTFQELDINANGLIDYGEFVSWWNRSGK